MLFPKDYYSWNSRLCSIANIFQSLTVINELTVCYSYCFWAMLHCSLFIFILLGAPHFPSTAIFLPEIQVLLCIFMLPYLFLFYLRSSEPPIFFHWESMFCYTSKEMLQHFSLTLTGHGRTKCIRVWPPPGRKQDSFFCRIFSFWVILLELAIRVCRH